VKGGELRCPASRFVN